MPSKFTRWIKHTPPAGPVETTEWRYSQRDIRPSGSSFAPKIKLGVFNDGVIFMNPPEDARVHAQMNGTEPVYDYVLTGHIEIEAPPDCPRFRCHSIKVRFRAMLKNDKPTAVVTDRVLFEREVKIAESDEGGILIEKSQRYDFSLILPSTLPPRDWGEWGCIIDDLIATLEGIDMDPASPPLPSPTASQSGASFLSIAKKRASSRDVVPSSSRPSADVPWLEGKHSAELTIRLIYNPDPAGGVSTLSESAKGATPGLGEYDVRLYSDVWTIASLLRANIAIMDIPSTTTIFNIDVYLAQTTKVTVDPDDASSEQTFTRRFLLMEAGKPVEKHQAHPDVSIPALWRGADARGRDQGELILELHGRVVENDFVARPSTLPSVITPARTSHALEVAVFFSCWGQDAYGRPMHNPGPGGLRLMKIRRPVMLPCCAILPALVTLPNYVTSDKEPEPPEKYDHLYMVCACRMSMETIRARMQAAMEQEEKAAALARQRAAQLKDLESSATLRQ